VRPGQDATGSPLPVGDVERRLAFLRPRVRGAGFPWAQLGGWLGCLTLTGCAYVLVTRHALPPVLLGAALVAMAATQAGLQLGVFMHLRESRGLAWQVLPLALALFTALAMVGMSVWIMLFKSGVS